jgi:type VI secretion system protein ImpL
VSIKILLFILFLYVSLIWVAAVGLRSGPEIQTFGLFWTAVGIAAVLAFVILSRIHGVWKVHRARPRKQRVSEKPEQKVVHPQDAAISALLDQANATLARLPGAGGAQAKVDVRELPLYILAGPQGSGKTSTFANSGLEITLLAGRATDSRRPETTELMNIWFAAGAVFVDISGLAFSTGADDWLRILRAFRREPNLPLWRRIWKESPSQTLLRGVIGFCHAKELIGASTDPQRFEQYCRDWRERLQAIGEVFGSSFPAWQVITNCDAIPFFRDYFRRLPESEANQVLGSALTLRADEAFPAADAASKRIANSFRILYRAIADRRILCLAQEPDIKVRAAIYEFPRELKRIRASLVQFLTDAFRRGLPDPGPFLRGYYFTAVCEAAESGHEVSPVGQDWSVADLEASRMFRGDATQMFRAGEFAAQSKPNARGRRLSWLFVGDLFRRVIPNDVALPQALPPRDLRIAVYRRVAFAVVTGFCVLLCTAFTVSFAGNRSLLQEVQEATVRASGETAPNLTALQSLETLRSEVQKLRRGPGFSLHMGLYSGNRVFDSLRNAYFKRFQHLLLNGINAKMVETLAASPSNPDVAPPFDSLYRLLKTHLMISSGACPADPRMVAAVLKTENQAIASDEADQAAWRALADRQIDFYASELRYGNPCRINEDVDACNRARQFLQKVRGVSGLYSTIVSNAEKSLKQPKRLTDIAPGYEKVLSGPSEMSAAFTPEGWSFVEKASKERHLADVDSCAIGSQPPAAADSNEIQRWFIKDYIDHWSKYLAGFSVVKYSSAQDAATKLTILTDHKSPVLALMAMTADATDFKPSAATTILDRVPAVKKMFESGENAARRASTPRPPEESAPSPADISQSFQPVHWVVPPASDKWVVDNNAAYVEALAQLGHSMQDIAASKTPDAGVYQTAHQNYDKALDAVRQIAKNFKAVEVNGVDGVVVRLLAEPVEYAKAFIPGDPNEVLTRKINGEERTLCQTIGSTLRKYPFRDASAEDATLGELAAVFAPASGAIWKFQAQSLGDLLTKDNSGWKAKDPSSKLLPTAEMLNFMNRAQAVSDAFYPAGSTSPQFTYVLRPKLDTKDLIVELEVDGQRHEWTTSLQKAFKWPAPAGVKPGAVARIRNGTLSVSFASRDGIWGIFRIIGDAEKRPLSSKTIEWKYTRGKDGRAEEIEPAPVRLEIVEFPGGADLFNPRFFDQLQCPGVAVQ